ncbi:MAG: SusD/RagB family nutrient-binding outer membrane lipoprotein [Lewinellaceae bacterium]|nr:SusD/RagB family nutrient-binding outer membrane lipoprotein [Lewinellaceae bacterium]MCB9290989.1 SusD/RagB family nutrient-binding outer membrane lipoprotein [Lewinellaceae bacterium]
MKYIKLSILFLVGLLVLPSCDKALDINTDPLAASSADPNVILPFVIVQYSSRFESELGTRIMDVPQHFSACFNSPRTGPTTSFLTGNTWGMYYTQVLGNLVLVEQDALAAGESRNNVAAIAKILKAKAFFELSCIWDKIPFSEALDGATYSSPNFDDQEAVFRGCLSILDEAISLIDKVPAEGVFDVSGGDVLFGGDMDKWRRWANSLKLRILMLIRNKDTSVDSQIQAVLGQPLIESNDQAVLLPYAGGGGAQNAFYGIVSAFFGPSNETAQVHGPGEPLYDLLKDGDPRFDLYILDPDGLGAPDNGFFPDDNTAVLRDNIIRDDLPHIMFLPSEISFYRAELALLGVTNEDAQEWFDRGLTQILEFWGQDIPGAQITLADATISDYVSSLPAVTMQMVHEQQYLESFIRPIVAWNTVRRTKVPALSPPSNASITTILKRFNYPPDEVSSNPNTPANVNTDVPQWFEN